MKKILEGEAPLEAPGYVEFYDYWTYAKSQGAGPDQGGRLVNHGDENTIDVGFYRFGGDGDTVYVNTSSSATHLDLDDWDPGFNECARICATSRPMYTRKACRESGRGDSFRVADDAEIEKLIRGGTLQPMLQTDVPEGEPLHEPILVRTSSTKADRLV